MSLPTRDAINDLTLALTTAPNVDTRTPSIRVLRAVLDRIGTSGFCWASTRTLAEAANLRDPRSGAWRIDATERALRAWAGTPTPHDGASGVLERLEARSGPRHTIRHALYYCPRLTGIPKPSLPTGVRFAVLTPCDLPECEPDLVVPEGRITRPALSAAPVGTRGREAMR